MRRRVTSGRLFSALAVSLTLLVLACGGSGRPTAVVRDDTPVVGGTERSFLMGISAQPPVPAEYSYRDTFALAQQGGEVVMVQRGVPWADFVPGGSVSSRTEQLTHLEKDLADEHGLKLYLAVDATSPSDRGHPSGLPERLAGAGFDDPNVRAAFVAYARYLALNYEPAYLSLGVEVDMTYAALGEARFGAFVSLYLEAYDAVKSISPQTLVFPTFQYEDLLGILRRDGAKSPSWELPRRFMPKIDMLAVSSFPGLVFNSIGEVPPDYYNELQGKLDRPVAFASVGWNSEPGVLGEPGEASQVTFLYRLLAAADELAAQVIVWHLGRDPEVVPPGFEPLAHSGLHGIAGEPKHVWRVWLAAKSRPAPTLP